MSEYYVDFDGKVKKKKKDKKETTIGNTSGFYVDFDGSVKQREQEIDEELAPTKETTVSKRAVNNAVRKENWQNILTGSGTRVDSPFVQEPEGSNLGWIKSLFGIGEDKVVGEDEGSVGKWAGNSAMSGLAAFNKGITSTANVILRKPLQALGWENNPISTVAEYYSDTYDDYKEKATAEAKKLGSDKNIGGMGNEYEVAGAIAESTVAALPTAILALMTGGASLGGSTAVAGGSAASSSLATTAAFRSGNLLTKAGLTTQAMAQNPQYWLSFAQTYGNDYEEAIEDGADEVTAAFGATITSLVNAGIEIGIGGGSGIQGLPGKVAEGGKAAIFDWVKSSLEEGGEEVLQGVVNRGVSKVLYGSEDAVFDTRQMLIEGAMGATVGGILGGGQIGVQSGVNAVQQAQADKLTDTEQTVFDAVIESRIAEEETGGKKLTAKQKKDIENRVREDLEKGYISTDTIEEALGGDTYTAYRDTVTQQETLQKEFDTLNKMKQGEMTGEQIDRRVELKQQLEDLKTNSQRDQLKQKLSDEVFGIAQGSRLAESYNEKARRSQQFEADLTKYEGKQQEIVKKAVESGILNNTNRTHEFVDLIAKIAADKGVSFDFTNNAKLKESGFAVDGATVNGYVTKDGVTVNIQSAKALNSVVGHEITHIFEGTELYTELQNVVRQYAESKGEYQSRLDAITKLYEGIEGADVNAEITADLVGDYLFTDANFVKKLSVEHRNVFQKVYDEIKYLAKVATAGSKEARQLEKAKKTFEDIYRDSGTAQKNTVTEDGVKYSLADVDQITPSEEQKTVNIREVAQMEAVYTVDESNLVDSGKDIKEIYGEYFSAWGENIHSDVFGDIAVKNSSIRSEIRHGSTAEKIAAIEAIPSVIENGKVVEWMEKAPGSFRIVVAAPIRIGNNPYYMGVMLQRDSQNQRLYLHDVVIEKEASENSQDHLVTTGPYEENGNLFTTSILRKILDVKVKTPKSNSDVQYSLSADTEGHQLTTEQAEYFKDSKVVDEKGHLKVMYHGTQNGGFHEFSQNYSDDDTSFFFTDSNSVAESYSGTSETYAARPLNTAEDLNRFFTEIGATDYTVEQSNGTFILFEDGDEIATSDTADGIYEEFRDWTGLGYGSVNYKAYLNLKNPLVVDAENLQWNELPSIDGDTERYDYIKIVDTNRTDGKVTIEYALNTDMAPSTETVVLSERFDEGLANRLSDVGLGESLKNVPVKSMTTRDYAQYAKENGYDGVIFKNIYDNGVYAGSKEGPSTVAIAFESNQIKSVANTHPTADTDIRHSLSDEGGTPKRHGNYTVYGKDIALEGMPIRDDLAPVQDTVQPTVQDDAIPDGFAPTSEAEANAMRDDNLASITDEDAPPEMEAEYDDFTDTTAIDPQALKGISKALKDVLYLNNKEVKAIGEVVQKYSTSEFPDRADLFDELQEKFGVKETVERNEETAAVKKGIRQYRINVAPEIKNDIPDYTQYMRRNFGKVRFSKEGVPVDVAYMELSSMFPGYFPADIQNASDQLHRIVEVANMDINETETYELTDEEILHATDVVIAEVAKYKEAQVQAGVEADAKAAFAAIEDIPVREDIAPVVKVPEITTEAKPIKTVKDRLSAKLQNYQAELAANQQQRAESQASYEQEISRLYMEYSAKKNKNTKAANDILRRIDRLHRMKGNVDADYAKRISDLEAKVEKTAEEVRTGESPTEQAAMRQEVHTAIVDNIKTTFGEKGYDLDEVLKGAKDLSTFATVDNTPQRVMEKSLGYKEGQILADLTVNKVAQNETEGIKWLNSYLDRKSGLLAQISKQYHIKPGSKESAAAQMYAEGFYVNENEEIIQYGDAELAKDFPDATVRANIKALSKDERIRRIYDETLAAINASRARNAYPEIQRLDNYFLHFRAQTDTFSRLGIPFNPNDIKAKDLPTDLNGVTADLKPGQPYFASAMHRKGKRTSFDLLGGLEQYLTAAKDQIYHIDDIQTLRALRNYIADNYGQAKGLDNLDALTEAEAEAKIKEVFDGHLSTFAKFLNEEANVIAGKTSLTDRGLEGVIGRRGIQLLNTLNRQVGSNMVGFNVSSSLTNLLAAVQGMAKTNKADFVKAMAQTTAHKLGSIVGKSDGFAEQSPVIIRRKGAERFHRTAWEKATDAGYVLMSAVDDISTEVVARAKYNELTRKGMDAQQAHIETDKWVSRLMGDRSLGQQPQLYNSKMLGIFTKFQLEVRNQLDSQFYDTIQEAKASTEDIENAIDRNTRTAAKIASTFFQLAVLQHLFGKAFESVAGYNPAFDIIDVLIKTFGWDDDEEDEDTALDNVQEGFQALLGDLPYTSTFTGGRIPISSALPIEQLVTGKDDYGNEKSRLETLQETAPYYVMPAGYSQLKKTTQGLGMFDDDLPIAGSYTDSGNLRYPVEDTPGNRLQAALFGQYASANARDYFDNERAPLKEKQIQEFIDLDLPIADYWKYREGLKGLETTEEKLDYIDSLDIPFSKKNIMANNVTDRENPIDMTGYSDYDSLEEFDFATKNPEKYAFFENSGITYEAYAKGDEDAKRAYNWAYENPGKYTVSKVVTSDVVEYRRYTGELNDITADKDQYGESISGTAKDKKIAYINGLDLEYGQKVILFRSIYDGKTDRATYNADIVEYLNSREDISYEEKVTILKELDFTVLDDGTVQW